MTYRSRLFATVALPLLSMTIGLQPALADAQIKPFQVAQSDEDEILKRREERRKQREAQQDQGAAQEDNGGQGGQGGGQSNDAERQRLREERRKQRAAQQQDQQAEPQQAQPADNGGQPSDEERQRIREERRKQRAAQQQDQQAQPEQQAQPADNGGQPSDEERQRIREERRKQRAAQQQDQQVQPEQQAQPDDNGGQPSAEERKRIREERRKQREAGQQQDPQAQPEQQAQPDGDAGQPSAEERKRIREERRKQREAGQQQDPQAQPEQQAQPGDDARPTDAERQRIREERRKQREAGQQPDQAQPGTDAAGDDAQPRERRSRDIVDTRSREERQKIARDPSASDDTVVLPVDNGAAVLDSDKDADNRGDAREQRRRQREQARSERANVPAPRSDADAQSDHRERRPSRDELNAAINEQGRRVDRVPEFNADDLLDAFTGRRPRIEESRNNRTVLDFGDEIVVRSDDRPRLRRDARDSYYEELPRGRTREVIERPNGIRVVTIYNRYGDVIQRTRINRDGQEYLMVYAPEVDEDNRPPIIDAGEDLPPMRLTVPVRDYIIDTSTEPDRNYYDFLAEPPVERVERTYSLDEVRNSARIRDKVRRIDLDTITFATGSAEVPMSQAKTLRKVADAMLEVIDKDPGETFLIEGHTDAVGSDQSNLVLSDERAESVASLLTDVYQIPPENLVTQGYGERFLKVNTSGPEQENRRVTIRRVTPLVRPVAQN